MNGPSEHLSWNELKCRDGTEYPIKWRLDRAIQLGQVFEKIRKECGNKPIQVLSGYRTSDYNKKVGGVPKSQHIQGRALDLKPPEGMTINEFGDEILKLALNTIIKGIGFYKTFVHVDIRPSTKLVTWSKQR